MMKALVVMGIKILQIGKGRKILVKSGRGTGNRKASGGIRLPIESLH